MSWQFTPFAPSLLVMAILAAGLALYALRSGAPGAGMGALFMAAVGLWGVTYAVELGAVGLPARVFWAKVSYLGIVLLPPSWVGFTAAYTGRGAWLGRRNLALLFVVPALTLAVVFTNEHHRLFWSETSLAPSPGPFVDLQVSHGAAFWAWVAYAYALLVIGGALVVSMLARSGNLYGKQGAALLFGMAAPWVGNALYLFDLSPVPGLDPTPFCLFLTSVAMVLAMSRFGLLDVVPVARAAVVEGMGDAVIVLDALNRVVDANPAARSLLSLPASEAIGLPAHRAIRAEEILRAVYGGAEEVHKQVKVGDGPRRRDYEVTLSSLRKAGSRRGRLLVVRDVTGRVRQELLFRLIVENALDVVAIYDPGARFRYVSPSVERVLGYRMDEAAASDTVRWKIHPEDAPRVTGRFAEIWSRPGVNPPLEFRVRHQDGSWRHVEGVLNNLLEDPEVRGVVASWRDVSTRVAAEEEARRLNENLEGLVAERTRRLEALVDELKKSERALRHSEAEYRAIFENAVEGIFRTSVEGRLLTANPAMARILGYDSAEDLLSSVTSVGRQVYAEAGRRSEFEARMREEGSVSGFEVEARRKDGSTAWVSVSARGLHDGDGRPVCYEGSMEDITGRVEARRVLERRLASLTRIAAALAVDRPTGATLDALAAGVVETTEARACSVYLSDPETGALLVAGSGGLPEGYAAAAGASLRAGRPSPALQSFEAGRALFFGAGKRRLLEDPSFAPVHGALRAAPWDAVLVTPLVARGRALGTLNAYYPLYPAGSAPEEDERAFLGAVADQAALAVENSRLFAAARRAAALRERQRISRELHDSVSQALYGIALGARTARTLLDRDPEHAAQRAAEPLEYVLSLAEAGLAEMRALIFELRPEALESEGLLAALGRLGAALGARHGVEVRLPPPEAEPPGLSPEAKETLYRIAQEALHNVARHARAGRAEVTLQRAGDDAVLEVRDDGAGFDPAQAFPGHLGLSTMRERAEHLGGTLHIESAPGRGTRILARVSLNRTPQEP